MAAALSERVKRFNIYKFVLSIPGIILVYSVIFLIYFLLRQNPNGNEPIFLKIGSLTFRWYGIIITAGVVMAAFSAQFLADRRGENGERTWVLLPIILVTGIIGARTWYVVNTWAKYKDHILSFGDPNAAGVFEVWRGGIAIQGAVAGGLLGIALYKWLVGLNFLRWCDFIAPGLVLAQACGRWGNFMNNEAYGNPTSVPWGVRIPCDYRTSGGTPGTLDTTCAKYGPDQLFHPTFLYESVWDYAVFLTLLFAIMKPKTVQRWTKIRLRDGDIFFLYLVLYSVGRFVTESLRTDPLYIIGDPVNGGIRSAQALAIISIFIGAFFFLYRHRQPTPDSEALSVRVRPTPTKQELRQQQLAMAGAGASTVATATAVVDDREDEVNETEDDLEADAAEIPPAEEELVAPVMQADLNEADTEAADTEVDNEAASDADEDVEKPKQAADKA